MSAKLDSFETQLLHELRQHVACRTTTDRTVTGGDFESHPKPIGRARLALVVAVAASAAFAALVIPGISSTPAFAVGYGNANEIYVEINRPEDADGLERALEDHGIAADITYLPEQQICAPGRYTTVDRQPTGMMVTVGERHISVIIPPNTVGEGETFVLAWSVVPMTAEEMTELAEESGNRVSDGFHARLEFDVAAGAVSPCQPIAGT